MATTKTGDVLKSSLLENYLQKSRNSDETKANIPSHIRMLCYNIMKLKEKKGERVNVFLIKLFDISKDNQESVNKLIKPFLQADDISLAYSENIRIISLFDKTDEQIECFTKALHNSTIQIDIEEI